MASLLRLPVFCLIVFAPILGGRGWGPPSLRAADGGSRFAHTDSRSGYVHRIDLYDTKNRKIGPDSVLPYSPVNTCGRCHDWETISHGWHFNAFSGTGEERLGEPWIWTDSRTGTQIPLSYRNWKGTFHPRDVGLTAWQMTQQFGGRLPAGGIVPDEEEAKAGRWLITGTPTIDCMICHDGSRQYNITKRRQQIEDENHDWAPTAAMGLGEVKGKAASLPDDFDVESEDASEKMPQVTYDSRRFDLAGKVFFDMRRKPLNNACYRCHSTVSESDGERWTHDGDVHLRAGMACADCHRNGIDHQTVRGFEGELRSDAQAITTLSCRGCHLDSEGGRFGAPLPKHAGLPPLHLERMACTVCHSGPLPQSQAMGVMTTLAHALGTAEHRKGEPMPMIRGTVFAPLDVPAGDGDQAHGVAQKLFPSRAMWPAFWGYLGKDDQITPLNPEDVYSWTRRALRVRKDFREEIVDDKLDRKVQQELLGDERAKIKADEWTDEEKAKIAKAFAEQSQQQFQEKLLIGFQALEEQEIPGSPVYVSGGKAYRLSDDGTGVTQILAGAHSVLDPTLWPIAHDVRPARRSLGIGGCIDCHQEGAAIFAGTLTAVGPAPDHSPETITMAKFQGWDDEQLAAWNQMFAGRSTFKIAGWIALAVTTLVIFVYGILGLVRLAVPRSSGDSNE